MEQEDNLSCEICGDNKVYTKTKDNKYGMILCKKHYQHMYRYGKIKERGIRDKNEIIIKKDYAEVKLYNINSIEVGICKIDVEDIDKIKNIKWRKTDVEYVSSGKTQSHDAVFIHRLITNCPPSLEVNHINFDTLDNRKINLEIVTREEQMRKLKVHQREDVCVYFEEDRQLWVTYIKVNKKKKFLGRFKTKEEAILKRKDAEKIYWNLDGEVARDGFGKGTGV